MADTANPAFLGNKYDFAFTIVDDTDLARLQTLKPIYDLLMKLEMRTTKTVWPLACEEPRNPFADSETLQDHGYAAWVMDLKNNGFEIAFHGASAGSNLRGRTLQGLEVYEKRLGSLPRMHVNHHMNKDNLYWGAARFDSSIVKAIVKLGSKHRDVRFQGHDPDSPYFWGDIFQQTICYSRNFTFVKQINLNKINPTLPYFDPARSFVPRWFSSCDGGSPERFIASLKPENIDRLVRQKGVCILYTHFGAGFVSNGYVLPSVEKALCDLVAVGKGYFAPASDLLDEICMTDFGGVCPFLPSSERQQMERSWLLEKISSGGTS